MGTGIVSILLHNLPYNTTWIQYLSIILFVLNVVLFLTFTLISIIRYTIYRGLFLAMLNHPVQSLFLGKSNQFARPAVRANQSIPGTFPMGLATIINMTAFVCVPIWGAWALTLTWLLWWIDVAISVVVCMFLPFAIMYIHTSSTPKLQSMTAVWLLPIVSTIVASASGGIVAQYLHEAGRQNHAFWTMIVAYVLWGTGIPLAMVIMTMYFHRLTVHKLPPREVIVSVFLPLGPLGQGGFAIMQLGKVARLVLPLIPGVLGGIQGIASVDLYVVGFAVAIIMWGYGLVWLFFALASVTRSKFPFNMGWWGFTFPLGVYTVSTTTIAAELPSTFFKVLGMVFSLLVILLWILVAVRTAIASAKGDMFFAPCAADFEKKWIQREIAAHLEKGDVKRAEKELSADGDSGRQVRRKRDGVPGDSMV